MIDSTWYPSLTKNINYEVDALSGTGAIPGSVSSPSVSTKNTSDGWDRDLVTYLKRSLGSLPISCESW